MNQKLMIKGVEMILRGMGVSVKDPNFIDTPKRVARMYTEFLTPRPSRWASFPASRSDMVVLRRHKVVALCPHHLQPAEVTAFVGYVPQRRVVGLSKLARVVDQQLVRPILQEDLANDVAEALDEQLSPKGVGVVTVGVHGCMRFRGVRSSGDVVVSAMRGVLMRDPAARAEFLSIIGLQ